MRLRIRSPQAVSQCFQSGISFLFSEPTPVGFFLFDRFPHAASAPPNTRWLLSPLCTSIASSAAPAHRHVHSGSWRSAHNGGRPRYHPHQHGSICLYCAHGLFIWHNHFFRETFFWLRVRCCSFVGGFRSGIFCKYRLFSFLASVLTWRWRLFRRMHRPDGGRAS